jgi:hypothetical protein
VLQDQIAEEGLVAVSSAASPASATAAESTAVAATAASTAAESTASSTSTAAAPISTAAAAAAFFAGAGFVDGQGAATVLLSVEGVDRRLGFGVVRHLDKAESLAATGIPVVNDLGRNHLTMLSK